ncbi:MAG: class C sortase [Lachnospiraceae bacterium]|nr:class C sortase [Lachnospiraceae bacterium]
MKRHTVVFCIILFLSGFGILLYPFVSNLVAEHNATQVVEKYEDETIQMGQEEIDAAKENIKKYNEQLSNVVTIDEETDENGSLSYLDMVNVGEALGYIVIPKIDVNLPIYSGISEEVLQKGVGHLEQSSYPLGGESTHSVLTGHRGLPSATLFTDLDKVEVGDQFYLHVLDEILAYEVDQIKVVEPEDSGELEIVEGEDYCTLVTCTPYAINTHRLLVRGKRTEYNPEQEMNTQSQMQSGSLTKRILDVWPWLVLALIIVFVVEFVIFFMMMRRKKKDKEE